MQGSLAEDDMCVYGDVVMRGRYVVGGFTGKKEGNMWYL